ncbi:MAG: hypothetical protein J5984_01815 [Clostridia bacterium]|jgi:lysophospholipase L1-like esterase|nr:hypothetical protein [Clostridia bacterium]MBO5505191.1 hypothetical protein [Clostridia bacterium]
MIKLGKNDVVVFLGDSITDGSRFRNMDCNNIFGHGYAEMICSRLGADNCENAPKFVNKGISGESSSQIYARLGRDCLQYKPTFINILAGVNDAGDLSLGFTEEMVVRNYLENLERMVNESRELYPDVKIVICEPFYKKIDYKEDPYNHIPHPFCEPYFKFACFEVTEETIERYDSIVKKMQKELPGLCEKLNVIFVPFQDIYDKAEEKTHISYFIWDHIHPTMVGHRLMADRWLEVVERELNKY